MKRSHLIVATLSILLSAALLLGLSSDLLAQPFGGHRGGGPGGGFLSSLTDEQREAIRDLIEEMMAAGATRQEIHDAISALFSEWGIEVPERRGGPDGHHGPRGPRGDRSGFWEELTEGQRAAIRSQMFESWQDGASHKEIRQAVREMLEDYGIEVPERHEGPHGPEGFGQPHFGLLSQLSDAQRQEIHEMVQEMRRQGAGQEQIRAAVEQKLADWGIELPQPPPELTIEQRRALRAVVLELWQSGATGEEIRSAMAQQLQEYDLQLPEGRRGHYSLELFKFPRGCFKPDLSEEQRKVMQKTRKEMRDGGATPEEIQEALRDLLAGWGINPADLDAGLKDGQRAQLRAMILELWLAGTSHDEICEEIEGLLGDFGIELPEDWRDTSTQSKPTEIPIQTQNFPNPANPETEIQYTLNISGDVQVQIFNVSGQRVRTFPMGYQQPGSYSIRWDGRGQDGQPVASGVYIYEIQAGLHAVTNRMVLLK